jgi:hypothetical protein
MTGGPRLFHYAAAVVLLLAVATPARAEEQVSAAAESLFQEGIRLYATGNVAEACDKFVQSQTLDPRTGTAINLGKCREEQGKLASAWAAFRDAVSLESSLPPAKQSRDRIREAESAARKLEERLPYLTIRLAGATPGLTVLLNGRKVPPAMLGIRTPVDPGSVTVTASAPGHNDQTYQVSLQESASEEVRITPLDPIPKAPETTSGLTGAPATTPSPVPPPRRTPVPLDDRPEASGSRTPWLPYVVGGAGLVLVGVGATAGLLATDAYRDAERLCPEHRECGEPALQRAAATQRWAMVSTIGFATGGAAVLAGAVLLVVSGPSASSKKRTTTSIAFGPAGLMLSLQGRL